MRTRSEEKRKLIIDTARALFAQNGYVGTSVDSIAEQAGLTKRTLYGYFDDKRELFLGVIDDAASGFSELTIPLEAVTTIAGLKTALIHIAHNLNKTVFSEEYIQLLRMVIAEIPTQPELSDIIQKGITRRALRLTTSLLTTAQQHEIIACESADNAARMFVGGFAVQLLLEGLLRPHAAAPRGYSAAQIESYTDDFLRNITK